MSENDNRPERAPDAYVSDSTRGQVPLKGHMVTFRFRETTYGPEEVDFQEMVDEAQSRGLGEEYVPAPLSGIPAYKAAIKTLHLPSRVINVSNWDNGKCHESWTTERIRGSRNAKFALIRSRQGKRNGEDYVEKIPVYSIHYVPQGEGDVLMRTWHTNFVAAAWGRTEDVEDNPPRLDNFVEGCIAMNTWDGRAVSNVMDYQNKLGVVNQRFREVLTRSNGRKLRDVVKGRLLAWNAIPWQSSSGGVYVIPDRDGTASYLDTLESFADLIQWWSRRTRGVTYRYSRRDEESNGSSASTTFTRRGTQRTNLRLLGYLDDVRTIEYLKQDIEDELNAQVGEYYNAIQNTLASYNPDNKRAFSRSMNALIAKKQRLEDNMRELGVGYIDGVEVDGQKSQLARRSIRNRIRGLGSDDEGHSTMLRNLLAIDTTATTIGFDDPEEEE